MSGRPDVDIAVVGGGPAGAATAIAVAGAGATVLVVDGDVGLGDKPGESLPPSISPLLHRLGVAEAFLETGPLPCYANRSAWGGDGRLSEYDFIRSCYGHGWHVDR